MKNEEILLGKVPPQAIEAEQAILGALLLEKDAFDSVSGIISEQSFYRDTHKIIFKTISEIHKSGNAVDLITVSTTLKDNNLLNEVGGPIYITQLTRNVVSAANIEHHARIVAQKYYNRETIRNATRLIQMAYNNEDVEILSGEWKQSGEQLENIFTVSDTGTLIRDVLKSTIVEIEKDVANLKKNATPGIPTGFKGLDTNTGGWRPDNLAVLAARPGIGKTSFALHFALEAAKAGHWVNIFSFEMNKEDLVRIHLASESGVCRSNIRDGHLSDGDWHAINKSVASLEKLPIIFKDAAGLTINQVQSVIHKNRKNGKCDFAIVDYMQLVKSSSFKAIRELEVSDISRTLKTISLTENIPILGLSQLNRAADGESPKLSNLRESGAIEQDADLVVFLHRPNKNNNSIIRLTVAKHRRGKLAEQDIFCNRDMTLYSEYLQTDIEPQSKNEIIT